MHEAYAAEEEGGEENDHLSVLIEELSPETLAALRQHLQNAASTETVSASKAKADEHVYGPLPAHNSEYKQQSYWDRRFETEESYEWLVTYVDVQEQLEQCIARDARVLIVGCGNSRFSEDMYDAGYHNIVNIDFSPVVIELMRRKHAEARPTMHWEVMDMTALTFDDSSFDAVIDKAAMDALMCDEQDVWNPSLKVVVAAHKMCGCVSRVLKSDGVFLQISFAQPHFRRSYLLVSEAHAVSGPQSRDDSSEESTSREYGWVVQHSSIGKVVGCLSHFLYIARKLRDEVERS